MLSIKKCKELLGETGKKWTDERIEQVRNYLVKLARINVSIIKQSGVEVIKNLSNNPNSVTCNVVKDKNQNV